jgi:hypothetical protein
MGYRNYATASERLATETRMLHLSLGDAVSNIGVKHRRTPITINNRVVRDAKPLHRYAVYPNSPRTGSYVLDYRGARRALPDEQLGISQISAIEAVGEETTFDLEIERTHNFIADGLVVHNCPQLAVYATPISEADTAPGGLTSGKRVSLGRINHVLFSIEIVRCIPTDVEPPASEITAASAQTNADAWALWNHLFNLIGSGQLLTLCQEVFFEGITAVSPSGGCAGWTVALRAQLDGYQETLGS